MRSCTAISGCHFSEALSDHDPSSSTSVNPRAKRRKVKCSSEHLISHRALYFHS